MSLSASQPLPWDEIQQIPDPEARYIQMGRYVFAKDMDKGYGALNSIERDILHVYLLESEVNNGGFDQYFINSAGDHAVEALESLWRIGAPKALALLQQAIDAFEPALPSTDRAARNSQVMSLPEAMQDLWYELDQQFCASAEPLWQLVLSYVESRQR